MLDFITEPKHEGSWAEVACGPEWLAVPQGGHGGGSFGHVQSGVQPSARQEDGELSADRQ